MATSGRGGPSNDNLTDLLLGRRRPSVGEVVAVIVAGVVFGSCLVCMGPELSGDRSGGVRMPMMNNFKQIAIALHNYQEDHGSLPPAVVYGPDGEPLYSWRVLVLPYLEEERLYRQFHLDEPWDSPHNKALLPRMPRVYAPLRDVPGPPHGTCCQVFVGKGTPFEGPDGLCLPDDFPDGTSNTFLVVEAADPVPWTKPADLAYDPAGPLPKLGAPYRDRSLFPGLHRPTEFIAAMADGSVRSFALKETPEPAIRARVTRNGGEKVEE
jgi:Protein of unknown function (DUF1559)